MNNGKYEGDNGDIFWFKNDLLHNENAPAIERFTKEHHCWLRCWYQNNLLHRENGPAQEYINSLNKWYFEGNLHREDGPAIEYTDGDKEWWIYGVQYTEEEFNKWVEKKQLNHSLSEDLDNKNTKPKVKV